VIPHREILALRGEWNLRADVIEKDYTLGWLLAAIAAHAELSESWIFKGGTCLRKCYFETYRFSEDLDFTIIGGGPEEPEALAGVFAQVREWLLDTAGIEIRVEPGSFKRRRNRRGKPTTEGRLAFRGPSNPPSLPKVKLDLTSDELIACPAETRPILHPYTDSGEIRTPIRAYSMVELFAEKLRALAERCRPRDLYDVVQMSRHHDLPADPASVMDALQRKCGHAGIETPTAKMILDSPMRGELEQEWTNMLGHQLPHLPPVGDYWDSLEDVFAWLSRAPRSTLEPAPALEPLDEFWSPPRAMTSWRHPVPLELIRFAGANHLKVALDYRAEQGRRGWRTVEPYALRRSHAGRLLLYVINDRGQLRSYGVDRIAGVRVLDEHFQPRYIVEF
jgi:predicted nucleotidyltransferase component of viral defense system